MAAKEICDCEVEEEEGDEVVNNSDGIVVTGTLLDGCGGEESVAEIFTK